MAVAGGLSVGIGFGIKEIISNFISSIWLLFEGSVRPGEILMINGDPCTVRKLGLRATQLRRGRDGAELLIPNQNFFTQEAESYTAEETAFFKYICSIQPSCVWAGGVALRLSVSVTCSYYSLAGKSPPLPPPSSLARCSRQPRLPRGRPENAAVRAVSSRVLQLRYQILSTTVRGR